MPGKVNESEWRMVRLRPGTVDMLRSFEQRVRQARENGQETVSPNERDEISLDALIRELIRRDLAHVVRGIEAAERRKERRKQEG